MNSMGEEHVIFLCLSLNSLKLLTKEIKNKKSPSFPDPVSLRLNFWNTSKTNRCLPPLLDSVNICFQSMVSRIFLYFFLFRSNRFINYFGEDLEQLLMFGGKN